MSLKCLLKCLSINGSISLSLLLSLLPFLCSSLSYCPPGIVPTTVLLLFLPSGAYMTRQSLRKNLSTQTRC